MLKGNWNLLVVVFGVIMLAQVFGCRPKQDGEIAESAVSNPILGSSEIKNETPSTEPDTQIDVQEAQISTEWKYDLSAADYSCKMPPSLIEISALGFLNEDTFLAVNDEKADLFLLDKKTCEVKETLDFGKKGDYEGVEYVGDITYILKSNGNVYPYDMSSRTSLEPIKSSLRTVNDVEGLGYDKDSNMLILACKGSPDIEGISILKNRKAFYGLDLNKKTLIEKPLWIIEDKNLLEFYDAHVKDESLSQKANRKLRARVNAFSPSAIAKHPQEGTFYILSSVGKLLVVCNRSGAIRHIEFLDESMFVQPEGIAFTQEGSMYISNEGKSFFGKIMGFDYEG